MKKIVLVLAIGTCVASCGSNTGNQSQADAQRSVDSMRTEMVKQHTIDSMSAVAAQPAQVSHDQPQGAVGSAVKPAHAAGTVHNHYTSNTTNTTNNTTTAAPTPVATEEKKKKGWSAKADGALIGAGVGAVTGAVVDKKHGQGAVIGGVLGAAAGVGTGAIIDKKNGR